MCNIIAFNFACHAWNVLHEATVFRLAVAIVCVTGGHRAGATGGAGPVPRVTGCALLVICPLPAVAEWYVALFGEHGGVIVVLLVIIHSRVCLPRPLASALPGAFSLLAHVFFPVSSLASSSAHPHHVSVCVSVRLVVIVLLAGA